MRYFTAAMVLLLCLAFSLPMGANNKFVQHPYFMANKGQLKDDRGKQLQDVDFIYRSANLAILVSRGKLTYCFYEREANGSITMQSAAMQLQQLTDSKEPVLAEGGNGYVEHYYLHGAEITDVPAAERICYKNIYPNIDWVVYSSDGKLEYEFILHKGAHAADIRWEYEGAGPVCLHDGTISWQTPLGAITEEAPESFTHRGMFIASAYQKHNGNKLGYAIAVSEPVTIDPTVRWATYQRGDDGQPSQVNGGCADHKGFIYGVGHAYTVSGFASGAGVHQSVPNGGAEGFISKFDTSGKIVWTSYFGGEGPDIFSQVKYAGTSLYISGNTGSTTGIATPGAAQTTFGTGVNTDGLLVRFTTAGKRVWATYCGSSGADYFRGLAIDSIHNIYVTGVTTSFTNIATPGSFKSTMSVSMSGNGDGMLLKYDSSGRRIWGTYLGDTARDAGTDVSVFADKVYVSGITNSSEGIATPGMHKSSFIPSGSADQDAYLMQFDSSGARLWGTYYGGNGGESYSFLKCNSKGAVYLYGSSNSTNGIASAGAWQSVLGGGYDCYLAKFDPSGTRLWATYLGGTKDDFLDNTWGGNIICDDIGDNNNLHVYGITNSPGLATADAWQDTLGGTVLYDAFLASIDGDGKLYYFTYYGGEHDDRGACTIADGADVYLAGYTRSNTGIATKGSYKDSLYGAFYAGFLVKFGPGSPPVSAINNLTAENMEVTVFPNPTSGTVNITATIGRENGRAQIKVLNIAGKTVQRTDAMVSGGQIRHSFQLFETLPPGIYHLQLQYGMHSKTVQVIRE